MATGGAEKVGYSLVRVGTVTLTKAVESPFYMSIVVCQDKIVVIDNKACKFQLHRLYDGKFLASSDRLESVPRGMCLMDAVTMCALHEDGLVEMMSIDSTNMSSVLKTTWNFRLQGVLKVYDGVVRFKDNLVVSGVRECTMSWFIVSLDDGHIDTIHQICKGDGWRWSYVTTKGNMIYILCDAGVGFPDTGVYGFDILNPSRCKYTYKHQRLQYQTSIVINEDGNIFVCNSEFGDSCIHQLTASCQLVAIFKQGIPRDLHAIFWDNGYLYVTCLGNSVINVFRPEYKASVVPMPHLPAGDTERFMRLTYVLVDVGTRILRQLLSRHTITPTCTLDRYLAKNRRTINSLLKLKVLHQSQMDILFPPNGGNTNIEDYDFTLLIALFKSIIPSLTQQEKDMINSLREDRNKLYGHAKSCKMNAMVYQFGWNSIRSTLITLSQQCGDPNFQNEISQEIQQIQVSGIPTGSYLDILKTWFTTLETIKGSLEKAEGVIQALTSRVEALELTKTIEESEGKYWEQNLSL